jgi:hypothetical protein
MKKEDRLGFRAKRVGYNGKNYEDDYETVKKMIKKIEKTLGKSKADIALALVIRSSFVCKLMDGSQKTSPTLLSAVNKSIKNKKNTFSTMVKNAYKVVNSKKRKSNSSNNTKRQRKS